MYKTYEVEVHIPSLIMHNGQTADPLNDYSKNMKAISGKRQKTEADLTALADLEFEAGLYLNQDRKVVLPGRVFEASLAQGAKKTKEGKVCLASTIVENDAVINYDGAPMTVEELKESPSHRLVVAVRVGSSKVMRTRPFFHDVEATFQIALNVEMANAATLEVWLRNTLNAVGVGDWRPRHGRGRVVRFGEAAVPVSEVA